MKYFKVKPEYDNKPRSDGSILVANELYTEHEVQKFKIPENRLSVIEVSPSNTIYIINLLPGEVWEFYQKNATKLTEETALIAKSEPNGHEVYLTEDGGIPLITVTKNGKTTYEEGTISENDTISTVSRIYKKYIYADDVAPDTDSECDDANLDREMLDAEILEQEDVLMSAFTDFLSVVMNLDYKEMDGFEGEISEIMESVLLMLTNEYEVSVYRPMFVMNTDTGKEEFTEYPYDEYDF